MPRRHSTSSTSSDSSSSDDEVHRRRNKSDSSSSDDEVHRRRNKSDTSDSSSDSDSKTRKRSSPVKSDNHSDSSSVKSGKVHSEKSSPQSSPIRSKDSSQHSKSPGHSPRKQELKSSPVESSLDLRESGEITSPPRTPPGTEEKKQRVSLNTTLTSSEREYYSIHQVKDIPTTFSDSLSEGEYRSSPERVPSPEKPSSSEKRSSPEKPSSSENRTSPEKHSSSEKKTSPERPSFSEITTSENASSPSDVRCDKTIRSLVARVSKHLSESKSSDTCDERSNRDRRKRPERRHHDLSRFESESGSEEESESQGRAMLSSVKPAKENSKRHSERGGPKEDKDSHRQTESMHKEREKRQNEDNSDTEKNMKKHEKNDESESLKEKSYKKKEVNEKSGRGSKEGSRRRDDSSENQKKDRKTHEHSDDDESSRRKHERQERRDEEKKETRKDMEDRRDGEKKESRKRHGDELDRQRDESDRRHDEKRGNKRSQHGDDSGRRHNDDESNWRHDEKRGNKRPQRDRDSSDRSDKRRREEKDERHDAKIDRKDEGNRKRKPDEDKDRAETDGAGKSEENKEAVEPAAKKSKSNMLMSRTGGAYIPPARLRMMQQQITDKNSEEYQRMAWEALKKSINGLVNKVNISNLSEIFRELLQENIVRGRGLVARSIIQAQAASPTFSHVYAAVVTVVNTRFPQTGELILKRLLVQFKRGYRRNDKNICLSSTKFLAHLVNQQVAHEVVALEILTLLLENVTDHAVEVAVGFLKEIGQKLTELSPRGINAIFERLRAVLHEGNIDKRIQYMVEVMFAVRKDGFKDFPAVISDLNSLVEEEEQITHLLTLDDATNTEDLLNVFQLDPDYQLNEEKYKMLKQSILDEGSDDESGSGSESDDESSEKDSDEEDAKQTIIDTTETNLLVFRRTVYLTIKSSLDFEEAVHKLLKMQIKPGQEVELCNMILDCCAQERTYEKFFGLLGQRFCQLDKKYVEPFQLIFKEQYDTCHKLDSNKLRNVAKFFSHLLHTDALSWGVLSAINLNEDDTSSAGRIFIKILFQDLCEYLGLPKLNNRLKDATLMPYFEGLLPRENPKNTRFAINFFTTIGLGGLTDDLREHLSNLARQKMEQAAKESSSSDSGSSSSSSSDSSSSDSSSQSSSDSSSSDEKSKKKRKFNKNKLERKKAAHSKRKPERKTDKKKTKHIKHESSDSESEKEIKRKTKHRKRASSDSEPDMQSKSHKKHSSKKHSHSDEENNRKKHSSKNSKHSDINGQNLASHKHLKHSSRDHSQSEERTGSKHGKSKKNQTSTEYDRNVDVSPPRNDRIGRTDGNREFRETDRGRDGKRHDNMQERMDDLHVDRENERYNKENEYRRVPHEDEIRNRGIKLEPGISGGENEYDSMRSRQSDREMVQSHKNGREFPRSQENYRDFSRSRDNRDFSRNREIERDVQRHPEDQRFFVDDSRNEQRFIEINDRDNHGRNSRNREPSFDRGFNNFDDRRDNRMISAKRERNDRQDNYENRAREPRVDRFERRQENVKNRDPGFDDHEESRRGDYEQSYSRSGRRNDVDEERNVRRRSVDRPRERKRR